jgi:hypothetical protein
VIGCIIVYLCVFIEKQGDLAFHFIAFFFVNVQLLLQRFQQDFSSMTGRTKKIGGPG